MKVTRKQLKEIIAENLLLEFSPTWFVTTKGKAMTQFLFAFLANDESKMISSAKSIANYFNNCDEMLDEINELAKSTGLRSALIKLGMPILDAVDTEDKLKTATLEKDLIATVLSKEVVGCDEEVIEAIKKLAFQLAQQIADEGKYDDYQIVKDFNNKKYDYLIT